MPLSAAPEIDEATSGGASRPDQATPVLRQTVKSARATSTAAWLAAAGVVVVYVWIVSAGTWTHWPTYGAHFQLQADGFRAGELSLAVRPDPRLLALPDPFDYVANRPYRVHDASLYNGRYYLYWGPGPALLVLGINLLTEIHDVPDQVLVFGFACASLAATAFLVTWLWRRFHAGVVPAAAVPVAVMACGLANPLPFLLGRAWVYEAAILGAQAALLAGVAAVIAALDRPRPSAARLLAAGGLLAFAVACRATTALPVLGVLAIVVWELPRRAGGARGAIRPFACLAAPVVTTLLALASYNAARFGTPLETGLRYQLGEFRAPDTVRFNVSAGYLLPNLYAYLLRPPDVSKSFPFVLPRLGTDAAYPPFIPLPPHYSHSDFGAGMLWVVPVVWFALLPLAGLWNRRLCCIREGAGEATAVPAAPPSESVDRAEQLAVRLLAAAAILSMAVPLIWRFCAMRFLTDGGPPLFVLAFAGFCAGLKHRRGRRARWLALAAGLAAVTALSGTLIGVTSDAHQFERQNPALFHRLQSLFGAGE
jgi:hypothetical protein